MNCTRSIRCGLGLAAALVCGVLPACADGGCGDPRDVIERNKGGLPGAFVSVENMDLACHPATFFAREGNWTFLLRGDDALLVESVRFVAEDVERDADRLTYPTPTAVLVDVTYPELKLGTKASLVLLGSEGELARVSVKVVPGAVLPSERRQRGLVRLQLQQGVFAYPLHGFRGRRSGVVDRWLVEVGGDEDFHRLLQDLAVEKVRKVLSRYAEDDSIYWDARHLRMEHYMGTHLRQYLVYLDEARSEAAYREILRGFPQVEAAFINEDHKTRPDRKQSKG